MLSFITSNKHIFKQAIFAVGICIVILSLLAFIYLIGRVKEESKKSLQFRVSVFEEMMKNDNTANVPFLFKNMISEIPYPVILTDEKGNPQNWINVDFNGKNEKEEIKEILQDFASYAEPIPLSYDSLVLAYYYYGEPLFLKQLKWLPVIVLVLVALLVLIAYYGTKKIRVSEKQFIWFGMAKEAAHQLGTPTSSLSGWLELLKNNEFKSDYVDEMEADINRIQTVINRFSMIGSKAQLREEDLSEICHEVVSYFRQRQPQLSKRVTLSFLSSDKTMLRLNRELIVWVLENLIRNAMDAIQSENGVIDLSIEKRGKYVELRCIDNGSGIESKRLKRIFETGYSSKRRGWGIGLSLSKRIIHEIHHGELLVEKTELGKGTCFLIRLKDEANADK